MPNQTILQRVYALADTSSDDYTYGTAASVLRQLNSDKDPAAKAHAITGLLKYLLPEHQELVVAAVESLRAKP